MATNRIVLREELGEAEHRLGRNLASLKHRAKSLADWREQTRKHPLSMLGVAFGVGCLAATLAGTRKTKTAGPRYIAGTAGLRMGTAPAMREPGAGTGSGVTEFLEDVSRAVVGSVTTQLTSFMNDLMPGFAKELEQQRRIRI